MSQQQGARVAALAERAPSALERLPQPLSLRILALLPVDARARCACVSRGWRTIVADASLWLRLDLTAAGGVPEQRVTSRLYVHVKCICTEFPSRARAASLRRMGSISGQCYVLLASEGFTARANKLYVHVPQLVWVDERALGRQHEQLNARLEHGDAQFWSVGDPPQGRR
jgi:hypothetical protein